MVTGSEGLEAVTSSSMTDGVIHISLLNGRKVNRPAGELRSIDDTCRHFADILAMMKRYQAEVYRRISGRFSYETALK